MLEPTHVIIALATGAIWGFLATFVYQAWERSHDGLPGLPTLFLGDLWAAVTGSFVAYIALTAFVEEPVSWMVVVSGVVGAHIALSLAVAVDCEQEATVLVHGDVLDGPDEALKASGPRPPYAYPYEVCVAKGGNVTWKWDAPATALNDSNVPTQVAKGIITFNTKRRKGLFLLLWLIDLIFSSDFRPFDDKQGNNLASASVDLLPTEPGRVGANQRLGPVKRRGRGTYSLELHDAAGNVLASGDPVMDIPKG